ncbi:ArdC-like ssDNA-binding domain-containing protein [Empedobacter falsenii]
MKKQVNEKRQKLIHLSNLAKVYQEEYPEMKINEILVKFMYRNSMHNEFLTFKGWKEKGFKVKKGEKAFLVWGKKRKKEVEENEEAKEFSFFPLAFIFSNAQVEQINLD